MIIEMPINWNYSIVSRRGPKIIHTDSYWQYFFLFLNTILGAEDILAVVIVIQLEWSWKFATLTKIHIAQKFEMH